MIINLLTKRIRVTAEWQTFLRVLPTRWRRKPAGIDTERNYVNVTLCTYCLLVYIVCFPTNPFFFTLCLLARHAETYMYSRTRNNAFIRLRPGPQWRIAMGWAAWANPGGPRVQGLPSSRQKICCMGVLCTSFNRFADFLAVNCTKMRFAAGLTHR